MTHPSTAREALIVEALGETARLLDRVEALTLTLEAARNALERAGTQLRDDLQTLAADTRVVAHQAKVSVVAHALERVNRSASDAMAAQAEAMAAAARTAFSAQAGSNLERLAQLLNEAVQRMDRPRQTWMMHAATGVCSAWLSWCVYSWFTFR